MAQILIRNLNQSTVARLKRNARANRRSLQAEAKQILEEGASDYARRMAAARKTIERLGRKFKGRKFPDTVTLIREDRGE
jgi:plasmid stability protein